MSYVRTGQLGRARGMAGAHRLSGVRGLRRRLGDDFNWTSFATTAINDAASVAQIAVKPPTYSSVVYPSGAQSIQSYGAAAPATSLFGGATDLTSLLTSPTVLLLGVGLIVVLALKR